MKNDMIIPLNEKKQGARAWRKADADAAFSKIMGEEVAPRRQFIEENAVYVENLDI